MQYGEDKPPMQCFVKLLNLWADIEPPTEGRKIPHYATRKTEVRHDAPRLAHELHDLMKTNPEHKEFLTETLDPINFTWRKCRKAAQNMKHHTAPGASGISIDMLMLLPEDG
jgi:hypothetical protein